MVIVTYVNGPASAEPGVKGTFTAPTRDIIEGIGLTKSQLLDDLINDDSVDHDIPSSEFFTILKAEVV